MPNENLSSTILNSSNINNMLYSTQLQQFNYPVESWTLWHEKLKNHFTETACEDEGIKKATLLKLIGSDPYKLLHNICSPHTPASQTYDKLCEILEQHYTPPTIIFLERKKFYSAHRNDNETVTVWFARVKELALNCKFGSNLDTNVLDKFIMGLPNHIFDRLCEENENLKINDALTKALIMETKCRNRDELSLSLSSSVNAVNNKGYNNRHNNKGYNKNNNQNNNNNRSNVYKNNRNNKFEESQSCKHCGWRNHASAVCKYKKSRCNNCNKIGHLSNICHNRTNRVKVSYINNDNNDNNDISDFSDFSVYNISSPDHDCYKISIIMHGQDITFHIDTGSPICLVPQSFIKRYNISNITSCQSPYLTYNGDQINIIGEYETLVYYNGMSEIIKFVVTNTTSPPLLGRNFLQIFKFKLTQVNNVLQSDHKMIIENLKSEYKELFNGNLGKYKLNKISLKYDENATPVFCKPRNIPFAWKELVEKEIESLEKNNVLERVAHSDWGTPLVPILKPNGKLRICGDYKVTINKYLSSFNYPLPRIEEIFSIIGGGSLYSKLDLSNAYNQFELDEKSQQLCTWSTHLGTFKMKRMPFGIKPAAAIFQKEIESLLRDISGVVVYQDDITITGKDLHDHLLNLKAVLSKLNDAGLKLNVNKCEFLKHEISYLGFNISNEGLKKNNERSSNILDAPVPSKVSELRAFIGIANYYSKFISNFSEKINPLYKLLQKNNPFCWNQECQKSYELIKKEISSEQVLTNYNPNLPIILTTDASDNAVAAVLSHKYPNSETKPIAFISRCLNKAEKNYSTLEKEALAIIFAVTKLKQYLLGKHFILKTDHKPLIAIFGENKGLPQMAAARIQRWAFVLSGFHYTIEYVKGNANVADNFSRIPQIANNSNKLEEEHSYINFIQNEIHKNLSFKDISRETRIDPLFSKLHFAILNGKQNELHEAEFEPFKQKFSQLTVEQGCILWGHRVVIPMKLRKSILNSLHTSHMGIVKTKGLARSYIWWPKIDNDIENMIKNCVPCQESQSSPEKSILIPWQPTESVWQRIHIDYAGPVKEFYLLIIIDSFSKWVEVYKTKNITTSFTLSKLRETFWRYGLVDTIVSDNGRQFTSHEFKNFVKNNRINHVLTAPGHPATNGQAENFIKTLKKCLYAMIKTSTTKDFDTILNQFLFDYRNSEHCVTKETPSKLFLGRTLKSRFSHMKPPTLKSTIALYQENSVKNFMGKRDDKYNIGDKIYIRDYTDPNKPKWSQATVKSQSGPLSYQCIFTSNNREVKRHLDQIRCSHNEPVPANDASIDINSHTNNNHDSNDENDENDENEENLENPSEIIENEIINKDIATHKMILRPRNAGKASTEQNISN